VTSVILSDHILNLFADLGGTLPHDKNQMLSILHSFLDMNSEQQILFRLGRRLGIFETLDDMRDTRKTDRTRQIASNEGITAENIDRVIDRLMERFI
jgi:hypothetical protein